jgi:hypothetical protein
MAASNPATKLARDGLSKAAGLSRAEPCLAGNFVAVLGALCASDCLLPLGRLGGLVRGRIAHFESSEPQSEKES